ncbi:MULTISPECIES: hypothetical protein [unclassified Methylobacterium]|uniref:hypothetical protein n=1 Tax=unclassified Methylobacterium TaxID=2615210 RepID=UPI002269D7B9|nr:MULTISPECIES: hypothetical protein [unclassified Methylobacterium]
MATALLPALRRNFILFVLAFAAASLAFGTVMLTSPPTSEAAVTTLTDDGVMEPATNCEFLPTGDINSCTVYR